MASNTNPLMNIRALITPAAAARATNRKRHHHVPSFRKDIILLEGPDIKDVPRQRRRLQLHNRRCILQSVEIRKDYYDDELLKFLTGLFSDKLGGTKCEILVAVGSFVAAPNLLPSETLSSLNLQRVLKTSASVYLRPVKRLRETTEMPCDLTEDDDEDDLPSIDELIQGPRSPPNSHSAVDLTSDQETAPPESAPEAEVDQETAPPESAPEAEVEAEALRQTVQEETFAVKELEDETIKAAIEQAKSVFAKTPKNTQAILRTYVTRLARPDARPQDIIYLNETIEGEVVPICISREKIVESTIEELIDACDERTVEALDTRLPLDVTFKLEGSMDFGGPRKEFFCLFFKEANELILDDQRRFIDTADVVENYTKSRLYFVYGLLTGLSLFQGGPVNSVVKWDGQEDHYAQLRAGLQRSGLWQLMENVPAIKELLTSAVRYKEHNSTIRFLRVFDSSSTSANGSNKRKMEEQVYGMFNKYIRQVFGGKRCVQLQDILSFVTGSEYEPILGFVRKPLIAYRASPSMIPTSSTCSNTLFLPIPENPQVPFPSEENLFSKFDLAFMTKYFGKK